MTTLWAILSISLACISEADSVFIRFVPTSITESNAPRFDPFSGSTDFKGRRANEEDNQGQMKNESIINQDELNMINHTTYLRALHNIGLPLFAYVRSKN